MTRAPQASTPPRPAARQNTTAALLFLAPNFLGFLVFTAGPVLFSLVVSFSNWNLQRTEPFGWIGLGNFRELLTDPRFWLYFLNTLYLMLGIPVSIAGSLFVALLMNQKLRGIIAYRTLFYLPSFTSGVALMILWKALYNPDFGPVNAGLGALRDLLGLSAVELPRWLGSMTNLIGLHPEEVRLTWQYLGVGARDAIIIMGIWTAIGGNTMLLYLAALSNLPQELTEAAEIDGAGKWQVFRHVVWPQLAPTTFFVVIMSVIGGLQGGFEQARIMTGGGPAGTTTTLSYYIYNKAFTEFQIGYASAVSWVLFVMIFVFTLIYWKAGSKELSY